LPAATAKSFNWGRLELLDVALDELDVRVELELVLEVVVELVLEVVELVLVDVVVVETARHYFQGLFHNNGKRPEWKQT
jgi:hypothetical protein